MQAEHVLLAGSSGGGKTTKGREMHAQHDGLSIWVNHNRESGLSGRSMDHAVTCRSLREMKEAVAGCRSNTELRNLRINYRCSSAREGAATARKVGVAVTTEIQTQIIIDEAHNALPDSEAESSVNSGNPVAKMLHEDRSENVKAVLMTQDPQDLFYPPIKQCEYIVWCGEVKTFHKGFLEYYNLKRLDLPTENYRYAVIKPTLPPKIVYAGETKRRYG